MHRLALTTLMFAFLALAPGQSARAQACNPAYLPDCLIQPTAVQGQDVAPYCFLPTLARGQSETLYAVTANDQDGQCHNFDTFLRFDLPANLLGPGQTVTFAALELPYAFSFVFGGTPPPPPHPPVTLRVHRVQGSWSENTVTWASKPPYDPAPTATLGGITNFGVKEIEVTQLVRNWAHGVEPNFGFALTSPNDRALGFNSWESTVAAGQKPALYIEVGAGAAPKPIPALPAVWSALLVLAVASAIWPYAWDRYAASAGTVGSQNLRASVGPSGKRTYCAAELGLASAVPSPGASFTAAGDIRNDS